MGSYGNSHRASRSNAGKRGYNARISKPTFSMSQHKHYTRRQIIEAGLLSASALTLVHSNAEAAGKLSPADPDAVRLGYVEKASQVDPKRFPSYKPGQNCENCGLVKGRYGFYRPCVAFPTYMVSEKGWCSAWVEKKHG